MNAQTIIKETIAMTEFNGYLLNESEITDKEVFGAIKNELNRQRTQIELIAS